RVQKILGNPQVVELISNDIGYTPIVEPVELKQFLQPPARPPRVGTPGSLLAADFEAVDFAGRNAVLDNLTAWRENSHPFSTRLLTGEGGQGKTRLAREFAHRTRQGDWIAGFIAAPSARREKDYSHIAQEFGSRLRQANQSILIIADYAEAHPEYIGGIIDELISETPHSRIRLLLLSRAAGAWWHSQIEALIAL